jgi:hypothetical protein
MIVPKKINGHEINTSLNNSSAELLSENLVYKIVITAAIAKAKSSENLLIFRTTIKPTTLTGTNKYKLPAHQLAPPTPVSPNTRAPTAAGLNKCFL